MACTKFHYMCKCILVYSTRISTPFITYSCVSRNRSSAWAGKMFTSDCENRRSHSTESGATCRRRDCMPNWRNCDFPCRGETSDWRTILAFCCTIVNELGVGAFYAPICVLDGKFSEINFNVLTSTFLELCRRPAGILWLCVFFFHSQRVRNRSILFEMKAIFRGMKCNKMKCELKSTTTRCGQGTNAVAGRGQICYVPSTRNVFIIFNRFQIWRCWLTSLITKTICIWPSARTA